MSEKSTKITLPREVAEAINNLLESGGERAGIIEYHAKNPNGWAGECKPLNGLDLDTLIQALYYGYEIEKSPEDKVREYYEGYETCTPELAGMYAGIREGVRQTLNLLGIKIEGVND
jgi:hypothetical protein